ncbi:MAG: hypothetical protein A2987_05400 [Omnitrophica bacterium RIFCSPLOWO2_01_FULL_45_10]|nr:MAG: hypothetical protein A2987_05400 [Omnitrophica bacterium RIFCSPLOWO2_01_FULL_45_10]
MNKRQIDLFFKILDQELDLNGIVILTGAGAGSLMGHIRPSFDIDFEIRLHRKTPAIKTKLQMSIDKAAKIAGVAVNYSENISGWSRINYLEYRKTAVPYKTIGKLRVQLIAPAYWTIGKMARFYELDIQDMVQIISKKKLKPELLIDIWAKAIRASDLSLELGQFRDHVIYFIKHYAKKIWGPATDPVILIATFEQKLKRKA